MTENKKFPFAIPFGSGGDKELIKVVSDKSKSHINTIGKSRFTIEDGTDLALLLDIGGNDPGTISFVELLCAVSFAEDGRGRGEHIMFHSGVISPPSMPGNNGHNDTKNKDKQRRDQQDQQEDNYR